MRQNENEIEVRGMKDYFFAYRKKNWCVFVLVVERWLCLNDHFVSLIQIFLETYLCFMGFVLMARDVKVGKFLGYAYVESLENYEIFNKFSHLTSNNL